MTLNVLGLICTVLLIVALWVERRERERLDAEASELRERVTDYIEVSATNYAALLHVSRRLADAAEREEARANAEEVRANAAEATIAQATRVVEAVSVVMAGALGQNEAPVVEERVKPFVDEMKAREDLTGHQKRMQVLLDYLKTHPGTAADTVLLAIEKVLDAG